MSGVAAPKCGGSLEPINQQRPLTQLPSDMDHLDCNTLAMARADSRNPPATVGPHQHQREGSVVWHQPRPTVAAFSRPLIPAPSRPAQASRWPGHSVGQHPARPAIAQQQLSWRRRHRRCQGVFDSEPGRSNVSCLHRSPISVSPKRIAPLLAASTRPPATAIEERPCGLPLVSHLCRARVVLLAAFRAAFKGHHLAEGQTGGRAP